jgi:hypothetical protein
LGSFVDFELSCYLPAFAQHDEQKLSDLISEEIKKNLSWQL